MRLRTLRAAAVALGLVLASSAGARAQGVSLNRAGSGARAAGMGDAFVAVSDDGTAASWNPAGLAQLRQPEFSLVTVVSERGTRVSALRSPDDRFAYSASAVNTTNASVDFAGAAIPFSIARRPVTVQVGWQRLYQLSNVGGGDFERYLTSQPGTPVGRVTVDDRLTGDIDLVSLAGAVKLTSRAAVGVSVNFWRGDWRGRLTAVESPGPGGPPAFLRSQLDSRLRGHTATVGLLLTYPSWNAGLVYHPPFRASFRYQGYVESTQSAPVSRAEPRARFRLPRSMAVGVAWRMAPRWMVSAAVTHDGWTNAVLEVPGQPAVNFFDELPVALSTTRDTLSFNLGAEHLLVREGAVWPLRLGVGWEPQGPMNRITRDPVDYLLASAGAGYNTNRVKLDGAFQFRWAAFRSAAVMSVSTGLAGGFAHDAVGRTSSHEWRIKLSAIYRIQDTARLRAVLRRIFG